MGDYNAALRCRVSLSFANAQPLPGENDSRGWRTRLSKDGLIYKGSVARCWGSRRIAIGSGTVAAPLSREDGYIVGQPRPTIPP